jgi:sulfonate transport system substrate-binding protein
MPGLRRPWVVKVAILALLVGVVAGCVSREDGSNAQQAPEPVPLSELFEITLQVGDQKGGTESLLRAAGALDGLPYKIAFSTFTSGPPQVEAATAGKIDFAITGNTPPIFGAASNARVKVVSAYDGGGNGDQVLVQADSPVKSIADLRGKRIAVGKGSSAHGHILAQLKNAGLSPSDVQLVFLQPADALSAFTKRQADAWAIWDPYTAQTEAQLPVRSIGQAREITNGYWFGVASDQALTDPKRNTALADLLVREGGSMGEGPPPRVGAELRGRSRTRSQGGRGLAISQSQIADRTR